MCLVIYSLLSNLRKIVRLKEKQVEHTYNTRQLHLFCIKKLNKIV